MLLFWSCATYQPPPPSMYFGDLSTSGTADLSLDDRIVAEDAWTALKQGNTKKAQMLFARLGTSSPFYYIGMGYASFLLRELSAAEEFFRQGIRLQPHLALAHLGLAQVYQDTGRLDNAFSSYREALKTDPGHTWALSMYNTIKTERTASLLNEAKTFFAAGDRDRSKEAYLKALFYSPDSVETHWNLARIFLDEGNRTNAFVHLKSAVAGDPANRDYQKLYADTLFQSEDYKSGLEIYEKLNESDPQDREVKDRLETIRNRLGIFELPSQYDAIPFSSAITKQDAAAVIGVKFKSIMTGRVQKPPIIIDIATSWAQKYILKTTSLGIMDVYPNHEFRTRKIITRGEIAETLVWLIDYLKLRGFRFIQHVSPNQIQVEDVSLYHFYHTPIVQILSYDIMSLESDRTFGPDMPIAGRDLFKYLDLILALIQ